MKRRLPQQPKEKIEGQNDDEHQPAIEPSDRTIRSSSIDINESTPKNSVQYVVEGQFDDASSPETGQFDDAPNDEIVNRRRKLLLIQGAHKRAAGMENQSTGDNTLLGKEAGISPGSEVKHNLVSFEESSPPKDKDKDGSSSHNNIQEGRVDSTVGTTTTPGGLRAKETSVSTLSKTGGSPKLEPTSADTTGPSTRSTGTGRSTLYESTTTDRTPARPVYEKYSPPSAYTSSPRRPINFRGTIGSSLTTASASLAGTKRPSADHHHQQQQHQRGSRSPHHYQHFELHQQHQKHSHYSHPHLPPNHPDWRHQQHHYQYFHHPPPYLPPGAGTPHSHSHFSPSPNLVDRGRRGSASSSTSSTGPPPHHSPYWGPIAPASLSSSSSPYINNPHQRQDFERQRRGGDDWMATRPRAPNMGTVPTRGTGAGTFQHHVRKEPNEHSRSIDEGHDNIDDHNDTVEENKMPPLNEARRIPMDYEMSMGMGAGYDAGGGGGKMPPLDQPPPRMVLNMHEHEHEHAQHQDHEEQVQAHGQSQNEDVDIQGYSDEEQIRSSDVTSNDVLMGRGGGTNRHNTHFRELVSEAQPQYVQARKKDKTRIARSIVATIRSRNGRFLKLHPNGYYLDVGDKQATLKTSQALREGLSGRMREIVKAGGRASKSDDRASKKKGG